MNCLRESPPRIPPHFGYDALGSELFEEITKLPDYYLTRVEDGLLQRHVDAIADELGTPWVVELGSGSAKKTRGLLAACAARRRTTFLPIDVSREMLISSADLLAADCRDVTVRGLWGRYEAGLRWIRVERSAPVTMMLLGSTLGNTTPTERHSLLAEITRTLASGDRFLVSADLIKPAHILEPCYNDPPGHSAFVRFRLNHLAHLNRCFDGDFVLDRFQARAHYNEHTRTVEGHLYAATDHGAKLHALGVELKFRVGDSINVGFSAKFDPARFIDDMRHFGLVHHTHWIDQRWQYGLFLFHRR
ncbi:L-histidine N(alpha)-methyltransferase [Saccharopolyspora phatthalungensis]|uniref:L-histidine N-alpha-methyltransferase n=1 Tax=Saccharopolyspora phatthalungensis TaxID=664693 RepID=A0A840QEC2_9PSEU|nr:L-histidine N(alpha)-methyltransferase [Saccharopolyspora phatthalungensis]MBB5156929.1 L-histidine N-alpha-methyltransferase [Saccharopolyspora phatthalungensis]